MSYQFVQSHPLLLDKRLIKVCLFIFAASVMLYQLLVINFIATSPKPGVIVGAVFGALVGVVLTLIITAIVVFIVHHYRRSVKRGTHNNIIANLFQVEL